MDMSSRWSTGYGGRSSKSLTHLDIQPATGHHHRSVVMVLRVGIEIVVMHHIPPNLLAKVYPSAIAAMV